MMTWLTFAMEHWFLSGLVLLVLYSVSRSIWRIAPVEVDPAASAMKWIAAVSAETQPRQEKK